jgi:hypothetical protein
MEMYVKQQLYILFLSAGNYLARRISSKFRAATFSSQPTMAPAYAQRDLFDYGEAPECMKQESREYKNNNIAYPNHILFSPFRGQNKDLAARR